MVKGELIGGLDILKVSGPRPQGAQRIAHALLQEQIETGEFRELLEA